MFCDDDFIDSGAEPDAVNFWMGDERAVTSSKILLTFKIFIKIKKSLHG